MEQMITETAHLFYQLKIDQAIAGFSGLPDMLETRLTEHQFPAENIQDIHASLSECMNALQLKEYLLVADLLLYDLLPKVNV